MNRFAPAPHSACAEGKTFVLIRAGDGMGANPRKFPVYMGAFPRQAFSSGAYMEKLEYGCIRDIRGLVSGLPPVVTEIKIFGFSAQVAAELKQAFDSRFSRNRRNAQMGRIAVLAEGIMCGRAQENAAHLQ